MSVIGRHRLSVDAVFELARLARKHGTREIRLLEPVRSGRYLKSSEDVFYTPADRKKLLAIQHRGNRTPGLPKFTSYLYLEGAEKFGCGAGILHSYIGETGELCPCDFIPVSFGSVRRGRLPELWRQMRHSFDIPRCSCIAAKLNEALLERPEIRLPLPPDQAASFCEQEIEKIPPAPISRVFHPTGE